MKTPNDTESPTAPTPSCDELDCPAPAGSRRMSEKEYCSTVCGAKCCKANDRIVWPKACPMLGKDNLCTIYEKRLGFQIEVLTKDGLHRTMECCEPEGFLDALPREVRDQCCYAHPEVLFVNVEDRHPASE